MTLPILLILLVAAATGQAPPPAAPASRSAADLPPETVVASIDGQQLTIEDVQKLIAALPPQNQPGALRDRKGFVQQFALMRKLAELAEKNKLDTQSPAKEALAFNRLYILSNAQLTKISSDVDVPMEEIEKFYKANQDRYKQLRVKLIYVAYLENPVPGQKTRTEAEARAKAEKIVSELRAGADFVKLVKLHSEDEASRAKDGDLGTVLRRSDNLPDAIRNAVFALKQGEITNPIRQPNGFYIMRAEEITTVPLDSVKAEIDGQLRDQRSRQVVENLVKGLNVKFENEAFFTAPAPTPPAPAKPPAPKP